MSPRNKIWFALLSFVLVAVTIACSCSSLSDLMNSSGGGGTSGGSAEPMPGLAGTWRDNAENTVHTIVWTGSTYHVVSSINDDRGAYDVSDETWDGSTFTWTYYVSQTDVSVTIEATSVSGNTMYLNWWSTNGNSGTDTFTREP
jgi:hypothetical protein